jgi:preprotein translocase subunit SecY
VVATLVNSLKVPEIRRKLAFTAAMLALYRLGAYIPAPNIDLNALSAVQKQFAGNNILGFLNLFAGGSLQRFAIFALGIMPYITASIILQLLTVVVPSLEKLRKEGEVGQQRITQYTRYLTVALASRSATSSSSARSTRARARTSSSTSASARSSRSSSRSPPAPC